LIKWGGGRPPLLALTEVNTALNGLHGVLFELFTDIGIDVHGGAEIGMTHYVLNEFQRYVATRLAGFFHETSAETVSQLVVSDVRK
jgi:hypothetical protein